MSAQMSRHRDELEARGFERIPSGALSTLLAGAGLTLEEAILETFARCRGARPLTAATDETGTVWLAPGLIDLSDLGFRDCGAESTGEKPRYLN